ncbi:hypothetical protein KCP70_19370 [Salmonella enterica subsp. enterica]|nr:hypothetical protein KCP70_19370 [Salmonella enterica subsp. enterica]
MPWKIVRPVETGMRNRWRHCVMRERGGLLVNANRCERPSLSDPAGGGTVRGASFLVERRYVTLS